MLTSTRLGRYVLWNQPTNHDHLRFPAVPLRPSTQPFHFPVGPGRLDFGSIEIKTPKGPESVALETLLDRTGSTALVVIANGRLAYEHYGNGGGREIVNRCFSVTKSITSALLGIAITQGMLGLDQTIGQWIGETKTSPIGDLTIRHLVEMRSGIGFQKGIMPWTDDAICYLSPDCRSAALRARIKHPVGAFFHYNDYHPFLIGMILERAVGQPLTQFLQDALWQRIGAELPASMTVDSTRSGFAHLESGLNATAIDLAKFGQLYLDRGSWAGEPVLPAAWVDESTGPQGARQDPAWFRHYEGQPWGRVFATGKYYYKYFWWGHRIDEDEHDYFAMGALGQHIYVSPRHRVVVVRLSERFPKGMWWPPVFRQLVEKAARAR